MQTSSNQEHWVLWIMHIVLIFIGLVILFLGEKIPVAYSYWQNVIVNLGSGLISVTLVFGIFRLLSPPSNSSRTNLLYQNNSNEIPLATKRSSLEPRIEK